jgi:hypothetical protein
MGVTCVICRNDLRLYLTPLRAHTQVDIFKDMGVTCVVRLNEPQVLGSIQPRLRLSLRLS